MHHVLAEAHGHQKRVSGPLELEIQTVLSHHVDAGNGTWVCYRSSDCFEPQCHLSNSKIFFPLKKSYHILFNMCVLLEVRKNIWELNSPTLWDPGTGLRL